MTTGSGANPRRSDARSSTCSIAAVPAIEAEAVVAADRLHRGLGMAWHSAQGQAGWMAEPHRRRDDLILIDRLIGGSMDPSDRSDPDLISDRSDAMRRAEKAAKGGTAQRAGVSIAQPWPDDQGHEPPFAAPKCLRGFCFHELPTTATATAERTNAHQRSGKRALLRFRRKCIAGITVSHQACSAAITAASGWLGLLAGQLTRPEPSTDQLHHPVHPATGLNERPGRRDRGIGSYNHNITCRAST